MRSRLALSGSELPARKAREAAVTVASLNGGNDLSIAPNQRGKEALWEER
ncbi:MAG: hypothetical protein VKJ24_12725 [Synechococcales bacterium]|nr:hypothetical protein [Synechococcales bacterium]